MLSNQHHTCKVPDISLRDSNTDRLCLRFSEVELKNFKG